MGGYSISDGNTGWLEDLVFGWLRFVESGWLIGFANGWLTSWRLGDGIMFWD